MKTNTKRLVELEMGLGRVAWVEVSPHGYICAKADFHPDDPIHTLIIGTPRECFKAASSTVRSIRNNRRGRVVFGNHAPFDWVENVAKRNRDAGFTA